MRPRPAAAFVLAALVAGCGTGLYDAEGVPPLEEGGLVCGPGQIVCANACTTEDAAHCGAGCVECGATHSPPANGVLACLPGGTCGYECTDGFLKCDGGCCGAAAVAASGASTCALLDDGTVRCWGANAEGQLGDGTTADRAAPVRVPLAATAVAIGVGERHACAVLQGGAVECWGANEAGQVSGSTTSGPVLVPAGTPVTAGGLEVAAGAAHTCARTSGGAVTCWGANALGQRGPGPGAPIASGATSISAGSNHTCAVVVDAVRCWGANGAGQLGDGTTDPRPGVVTPLAAGIVAVAASADQSCASTGVSNNSAIDDVVRCWGDSVGPAFLLGSPQPSPRIPLRSDGTQSTLRYDVPRLVAGRHHVCADRKAEAVECFGADASLGQLGGAPLEGGTAVAVPLPVTAPAARAFAAGADHACAALGDGRLRCWGANAAGQLGDGTSADPGVGLLAIPSGR